jgi:hypothetical protein
MNTVDSLLFLSRSKISKNLLRIFNKKQEKNIINNSFINESKIFENEIYFNLKGKSLDLRQKKEKKKIEFEEKLEKIKKDRKRLLCENMTNNISKKKTTMIPQNTALIF